MKLFKERSRLNISKFFYSNRVISCWNNLPDYIITAESINSFKNRLDNYCIWSITGYGYLQSPWPNLVTIRFLLYPCILIIIVLDDLL